MTIASYTVFNIAIIEITFFLAELIIRKKKFSSAFITTFVLALIVMLFSFFGPIYSTFGGLSELTKRSFQLSEILLLFFNMFYGYWRGLNRISEISKKYGNL